jgi:hypothetical protein
MPPKKAEEERARQVCNLQQQRMAEQKLPPKRPLSGKSGR